MSGLDPVGRPRSARHHSGVEARRKDGDVFNSTFFPMRRCCANRVGVIVGGKLRGVGAAGQLVDMKTQGMEILFE